MGSLFKNRRWRNPLRRTQETESQPEDAGEEKDRRDSAGMFVRLATGKRVEIPEAEYAMPEEGGRLLFLDKNRQVVREFAWGEVIAHGRRRK